MKMFQYHHLPWVRSLRSFARSSGMIGFVRRVTGVNPASQEEAFQRALQSAIRNDDIVWDIGANIGFYTTQFLGWTEPAGKVVAFEPLPEAFRALKDSLEKTSYGSGRWVLHQAAITDFDGEVTFTMESPGNDSVSTISHIADSANGQETQGEKVQAVRVDSAVQKLGAPAPKVTKIDVEGYEEEVLIGGTSTFSSTDHRELFIEVHFTRLAARDKSDAPANMVKLLKTWGYQVEWLDASHLRASRSTLS